MAEPFIRLGDDGENAPQLRYSVPESTDYVGNSIIAVDIDPALLNEATRDRLQDNLRRKRERRPVAPDDLRLSGLSMTARSPGVASLATRTDVRTAVATAPSSFIVRPQDGLIGFAGFDLVAPTPRPDETIAPRSCSSRS